MIARFIFSLCLLIGLAASAATTVDKKNEKKQVAETTTSTPAVSAVSHANRNYPGGRDDEDLKVQETLVPPTAKIDRRTIESKVLKINSKKVDTDEPEATEQ